MKRLVFVFLLFGTPAVLWSQSFYAVRHERTLILTAGTGTSTYYGELSNPGTIVKLQPNLNVGLMKYISPNVSIRTELNWFVLQGSDKIANDIGRKVRGLSFRSNCFEASAIGEISLYANGNRYYRRPTLNFYSFIGFGVLYFNPVADYKGKTYSLEPLHTEGKSYSRVAPVIPFGLGMRLKLSPNVNLAIEGGYRKTFTDYLDDVSTKYASKSSDPVTAYFQNPNNPTYNPDATTDLNTAVAGAKRGNPNSMDSYFLLNAKLEYYLPFHVSTRKGMVYKRKSNYRYNRRGGIRRR